jgi:tetratricopeptide (TPR) repeat protein
VATLRIRQAAEPDGRHRVDIDFDDADGHGRPVRRHAATRFAFTVAPADRERLRWYFEDYLEYPADPAPALAAEVEHMLTGLGVALFRAVFHSGDGARDLWATVRDRLPSLRVEVESDVDGSALLPWELLRDPATQSPLACAAAAFVRTHPGTARGPVLPPPASGGRLRVLLVICRPAGGDDVPFRSVAGQLVRHGGHPRSAVDLDVLRPPTFARLEEVLRTAARAGAPYQVVHFDGHGTWASLTTGNGGRDGDGVDGDEAVELSPTRLGVLSPIRPGAHGYLLFEAPGLPENRLLVDGPALGRLLAETGVGVLVLNACRSAYADTPPPPTGGCEDGSGSGRSESPEADDVHGRVRAYGSLAQEVADTGTAGVVAMRYSVYVDTAARLVATVYNRLLDGQPLGEAVGAARRQLAADPHRTVVSRRLRLQDWAVPLVYEATPLALVSRPAGGALRLSLDVDGGNEFPAVGTARGTADGIAADAAGGGLPRPPDAGFYGRHETLLAVDRAFDTHRVLLVHGSAGAGKTTVAAEFARWYAATGGLDHPELGAGPVLFTSFEHHRPLSRVLDQVGDAFAPLLEANGVHWLALDDTRRRRLTLDLLAQVPLLWIWDNVEPVTGFPTGTPSAWTEGEQAELAGFLRDLGARTEAKVLLTSRRDEEAWLAGLPTRIRLPAMPMLERLQLAEALARRHGRRLLDLDAWHPLLAYTAGNPLTLTVLVGQALRERLASRAQVEAFLDRLRAGEADIDDDHVQGRSASLGASLSYGLHAAFTEAEQARLAVLHLFHGTVDVDALVHMGTTGTPPVVPALAGLTREQGIALLDRAADIGLLTSLGGGYYAIHPALPWYFTTLFHRHHPDEAGQAVARAYTTALAILGTQYLELLQQGHQEAADALADEEANLLHAHRLARTHHRWDRLLTTLDCLNALYDRQGRTAERARLAEEIIPDLVAPGTDRPLPGRGRAWTVLTGIRIDLATEDRDWPTATRLLTLAIDHHRRDAAAALAADPGTLGEADRERISLLALDYEQLGRVQTGQEHAGCVTSLRRAADLYRRIDDRSAQANIAGSLANAYLEIPALRDLDRAEHHYRESLALRPDHDRLGRARDAGSLGLIARQRLLDARRAGAPAAVLTGYLRTAAEYYHQDLALLPADAVADLAVAHNQLGAVYADAGRADSAITHYQKSINLKEAADDRYGAGTTRRNIASLLARAGRYGEALAYAHAALADYTSYGPAAATAADQTRQLIAKIEKDARTASPRFG